MGKVSIELSTIQAEVVTRLLIQHRKELNKAIDNIDNYYIPNIDHALVEQKKILKNIWKSHLRETTQLIKELKEETRNDKNESRVSK